MASGRRPAGGRCRRGGCRARRVREGVRRPRHAAAGRAVPPVAPAHRRERDPQPASRRRPALGPGTARLAADRAAGLARPTARRRRCSPKSATPSSCGVSPGCPPPIVRWSAAATSSTSTRPRRRPSSAGPAGRSSRGCTGPCGGCGPDVGRERTPDERPRPPRRRPRPPGSRAPGAPAVRGPRHRRPGRIGSQPTPSPAPVPWLRRLADRGPGGNGGSPSPSLALLVALLATPPVRAAVADWFGFAGVIVQRGPVRGRRRRGPPPPATDDAMTVAEAGDLVEFTPLCPRSSASPTPSTSRPTAYRLDELDDRGGPVRLDQFDGRLDCRIAKTSPDVRYAAVGGDRRPLVRRPHEVVILDEGGGRGPSPPGSPDTR